MGVHSAMLPRKSANRTNWNLAKATPMNLFRHFEALVLAAIDHLKNDGVLPAETPVEKVTVEPPRDPTHGDIATNAAMVLAKPAKKPPREIASLIAAQLKKAHDIKTVEIAGPGFINMVLADSFWPQVIHAIHREGDDFGRPQIGQGQPVNVEYVSANPTGPMHVGHCRGAVFGDALANLLEFAGYEVTREYYINDAGAQVDVLARSAYLRYREAMGQEIGEIPSGLYPGDYLKPVGEALKAKYGDVLLDMTEQEWLPRVRDFAIDAMMTTIKGDLAALNIRHDVFFSERSLTAGGVDQVAQTIDELRAKHLIYEGRLPPPKGKRPDDWEDRKQTLFRAEEFGDDSDRALIKSDGSYTYFAADMAYHRDKIRRGFKEMIDVWGADHGGYIKRMKAAVAALSGRKANLDVKICQLVNLLRDGEPVKMSKRAGSFVTLRDVVDEVGADATRFMMLFRKNDAPLDFDLVKVVEQSRDNPVFYVQYAHARAHSVFRKVRDDHPELADIEQDFSDADLSRLNDAAELGLIKSLAAYPRLMESAAKSHEPHRIAFYLHDLASTFHGLWNRGIDLPHLRFNQPEDKELTKARLALVAATAKVLASGLKVLGVTAVRELR